MRVNHERRTYSRYLRLLTSSLELIPCIKKSETASVRAATAACAVKRLPRSAPAWFASGRRVNGGVLSGTSTSAKIKMTGSKRIAFPSMLAAECLAHPAASFAVFHPCFRALRASILSRRGPQTPLSGRSKRPFLKSRRIYPSLMSTLSLHLHRLLDPKRSPLHRPYGPR